MKMKWLCICLMAFSLFSSGCNSNENAPGKVNTKAFASANAEVKKLWENALTAGKTNDYFGSISICKDLLEWKDITPAQTEALQNQMAAVSNKMYDAAGKGDQQAQEASEKVKATSRRR